MDTKNINQDIKTYFIRFGEIPDDEQSSQFIGTHEVKKEQGVSVYNAICIDDKWHVIMPSILIEGQGNTYENLIQSVTGCRYYPEEFRQVYLVTGDEVGSGSDGEPVLKNVKIVKNLTEQFAPNVSKIYNKHDLIKNLHEGDFVLLNNQVKKLDLLTLINLYSSNQELEFIPITSELLLKNGFVVDSIVKEIKPDINLLTNFNYHLTLCDNPEIINSSRKWSIHIDNQDSSTILNGEVTYVHELQQLYRISRNEEIEFIFLNGD